MDVLSDWCATLQVNEDDRFFFDHPLDHVPGMLLFDAVTRAVAQAATVLLPPGSTRRRIAAVDARFPHFCEKDRSVLLRFHRPDPDDAGTGRNTLVAEAWQDGVPVCLAEVDTVTDHTAGPAPAPAEAAAGTPRADRRLVHKRLPGNVLVGPLSVADPDEQGAAFGADVPVPTADLRAVITPVTLLVEAARQLIIMGGHEVSRIPMEWQYVISSLRLRLTGPVSWAQPVALRSHSRGQDKRATGFDVQIWSGGRPTGQVSILGRALPPPVYRRLRAAGQAAAAPVHHRAKDLGRTVTVGPA